MSCKKRGTRWLVADHLVLHTHGAFPAIKDRILICWEFTNFKTPDMRNSPDVLPCEVVYHRILHYLHVISIIIYIFIHIYIWILKAYQNNHMIHHILSCNAASTSPRLVQAPEDRNIQMPPRYFKIQREPVDKIQFCWGPLHCNLIDKTWMRQGQQNHRGLFVCN